MTPKEVLLKNFLEEFFDFKELKKVGFFDQSITKTDYEKQADRICRFFGLKTIYEYGAREISCHLSFSGNNRPNNEPFITVIPNIYES